MCFGPTPGKRVIEYCQLGLTSSEWAGLCCLLPFPQRQWSEVRASFLVHTSLYGWDLYTYTYNLDVVQYGVYGHPIDVCNVPNETFKLSLNAHSNCASSSQFTPFFTQYSFFSQNISFRETTFYYILQILKAPFEIALSLCLGYKYFWLLVRELFQMKWDLFDLLYLRKYVLDGSG
jgi:hypothetical protein